MANSKVESDHEEQVPFDIIIVKEESILERDFWENNNEKPFNSNNVQRITTGEIGETSSLCAANINESDQEDKQEVHIDKSQSAVEIFGSDLKPSEKLFPQKAGKSESCLCGLRFQRKSGQINDTNTNKVCEKCSEEVSFTQSPMNTEIVSPIEAASQQHLTKEHFSDAVSLPFSRKEEENANDPKRSTALSSKEERIPKCNLCNKVFKSLSTLKIHVRRHTGETPYACKICKKEFSRIDNYKIHLRVHTRETPYRCNVCEKEFSYLSNLRMHKRLHTGETPHECKICGRAFTQSSSLKYHMRVHTGERPYQCKVCQKEFKRMSNLNVHARTHTGETPFECDVCKKSFSRLDFLKMHVKLHSDETPFVCEVCGKQFNMMAKLKSHMRVHTGERPYKCDICKKQFKHLSNIKAHLRVHTGEMPFKCNACAREFRQLQHLKVHMELHNAL